MNGRQVVQDRKLTEAEIRALEAYPEIQNDPCGAITALALAVEKLKGD
jgi:hypothetical protein